MAAPSTQTIPNLRRFQRYSVNLAGTAFFPDAATGVQVRDISFGGARIELPLPARAYAIQGIRALRIAGVLQLRVIWRWSQDRQTGLEFAAPDLARGAIDTLIDRLSDDRL